MLHNNNTPFAAIGFEQWHRDGATMACIAVRAEFILREDGLIALADQQEIVLADEFAGDPQKTPLIRTSDLVPFKPCTDITCLGPVVSPDGLPHPTHNASIEIDQTLRSIRAHGPRIWEAVGDSWRLGEPEPVTDIPLCYSLASGGRVIGHPDGVVDPRNPIGRNLIHPDYTPKGRNYPAAQIDMPDHSIHDDFNHPPFPQGWGPMSPWWQARQQFAGTYDDAWRADRHPRLPQDFDYRFYNVAHPDLRAQGLLTGKEQIVATNLGRPGAIRVFLPDTRPYATFGFKDGREVVAELNLDGVHLDFRQTPFRYAITWRGWMDVCPSFLRVDLDFAPIRQVEEMTLLAVGADGLKDRGSVAKF